jgi:hypothetical protein
VQQLVNARGAQLHCRGDLSDRQARLMRGGDGCDSLLSGRLEPVGSGAQAVPYVLFALEPLAPLLRSVHVIQDA